MDIMGNEKFSEIADQGFRDAVSYDTHRPTYPPPAITSLLTHLNLINRLSAKIIDLGAGTGKLTKALVEREEGFEILAVEPHGEMRGVLKGKFEGMGKVVVRDGTSTSIPVEDGWADGVFVAQAFHWFANEESLREIHRVLNPGGSLGFIWNIENYNSPLTWPAKTAWEESLKALTWSFSDSQPRFRHLRWKEIFEPTSPSFDWVEKLFNLPISEEKFEWTTWLSVEALWERYCTLSQISVTQGEERVGVRKIFDEAVGMADAGKGERNETGEVGIHGVTVVYWLRRV